MLMVPVYALFSYGVFKLCRRTPKYTHHLCFWGALWLISFVMVLGYQT